MITKSLKLPLISTHLILSQTFTILPSHYAKLTFSFQLITKSITELINSNTCSLRRLTNSRKSCLLTSSIAWTSCFSNVMSVPLVMKIQRQSLDSIQITSHQLLATSQSNMSVSNRSNKSATSQSNISATI